MHPTNSSLLRTSRCSFLFGTESIITSPCALFAGVLRKISFFLFLTVKYDCLTYSQMLELVFALLIPQFRSTPRRATASYSWIFQSLLPARGATCKGEEDLNILYVFQTHAPYRRRLHGQIHPDHWQRILIRTLRGWHNEIMDMVPR